jgi:hypothetical protein
MSNPVVNLRSVISLIVFPGTWGYFAKKVGFVSEVQALISSTRECELFV